MTNPLTKLRPGQLWFVGAGLLGEEVLVIEKQTSGALFGTVYCQAPAQSGQLLLVKMRYAAKTRFFRQQILTKQTILVSAHSLEEAHKRAQAWTIAPTA